MFSRDNELLPTSWVNWLVNVCCHSWWEHSCLSQPFGNLLVALMSLQHFDIKLLLEVTFCAATSEGKVKVHVFIGQVPGPYIYRYHHVRYTVYKWKWRQCGLYYFFFLIYRRLYLLCSNSQVRLKSLNCLWAQSNSRALKTNQFRQIRKDFFWHLSELCWRYVVAFHNIFFILWSSKDQSEKGDDSHIQYRQNNIMQIVDGWFTFPSKVSILSPHSFYNQFLLISLSFCLSNQSLTVHDKDPVEFKTEDNIRSKMICSLQQNCNQ